MKELNKIATEETVNEISESILASVRDKIKDQIADSFYKRMETYLYEHYDNHKDKIEAKLIEQITEEFVSDPKQYKFKKFREKLFHENKELLVKTLSNEAIEQSVENVFLEYTHRDYTFDWEWKDAIVRIILEHWQDLKDDERIKSKFSREIDNLKGQISFLRSQLDEAKSVLE